MKQKITARVEVFNAKGGRIVLEDTEVYEEEPFVDSKDLLELYLDRSDGIVKELFEETGVKVPGIVHSDSFEFCFEKLRGQDLEGFARSGSQMVKSGEEVHFLKWASYDAISPEGERDEYLLKRYSLIDQGVL